MNPTTQTHFEYLYRMVPCNSPEDNKLVKVLYEATPKDSTGKLVKFSETFQLPMGWIRQIDQDKNFLREITNFLWFQMHAKMMAAGPWRCSSNEKCTRMATKMLGLPMRHGDCSSEPYKFSEIMTIPVCGNAQCETMAQQVIHGIVPLVASQQSAPEDRAQLLNTMLPSCRACQQVGTPEKKMYTCSRCKAVFYCSRECQRRDWKEGQHKKQCFPLI